MKTVGSIPTSISNEEPKPSQFTISVEPEDMISTLHKKIEDVTGLGTHQQRLIYRGRMIGGKATDGESTGSAMTDCHESKPTELRICDVDGLDSGHTIHLVPRPAESSNAANSGSAEHTSSGTAGQSNQRNLDTSDLEGGTAIFGGSGGGGLLAALLGMGLGSPNIRRNDDGDDDYDIEAFLSSIPLGNTNNRPTRSARRRPNSHRRTAMDERYPNPCPLEPVRQGLLTLHTMIGSESSSANNTAPFLVKRTFYRGQWLDIRDTVNQWLEATVVEVMMPDEILIRKTGTASRHSGNEIHCAASTSNRLQRPAMDPAIGANDHKGRLRLLLEESEEESDRTLADLNNDDDLIGWKERDSNDNVQLLLVHYNGWPHRWDEWIRSDSERIRPFRTRSKHEPCRGFLSPSPEATFHSAPPTFVKSDDDSVDRVAILPELHRSLADVASIFSGAIRVEDCPISPPRENCGKVLTNEEQSDLSDAIKALQPEKIEEVMKIVQGTHEGGKDMDPSDIDVKELDSTIQWKLKNLLQPSNDLTHDDELPWKLKRSNGTGDNFGQYEGFSNSVPTLTEHPNFDKNKLEALAPLLDRLGRIMIDAAPHVASIADSLPESDKKQEHVASSNGAACLDSTLSETSTRQLRPAWSDVCSDEQTSPEIDSDYVDFIHGFINHRQSHIPPPRRSRRDQSDSNLGSTLLSAYLASAMSDRNDGTGDNRNGPRVVRIGGGSSGGGGSGGVTGNGVGIHIHAVVTGPGGISMPGLPNLGGATPDPFGGTRTAEDAQESIHQNDNRPVNEPQRVHTVDNGENGLFDDLYAEEPVPNDVSPISGENSQDEIVDDVRQSSDSTTSAPPINHRLDVTSIDGSVNSNDSLPPLYEPNDDSDSSCDDEPPPQIDLNEEYHSNDDNGEVVSVVEQNAQSSREESGDVTPGQEERERRAPLLARIFRRTMQRRSSDN